MLPRCSTVWNNRICYEAEQHPKSTSAVQAATCLSGLTWLIM